MRVKLNISDAIYILMQFTEQLFIDLVLPHIEGKNLPHLRRVSRAIKNKVDPRIIAFIGVKANEIWDFIINKALARRIHLLYTQNCFFDEGWRHDTFDDKSVLIHFQIEGRHKRMSLRYNLLTSRAWSGIAEHNIDFWPDSGYIKFTTYKSHGVVIFKDLIDELFE